MKKTKMSAFAIAAALLLSACSSTGSTPRVTTQNTDMQQSSAQRTEAATKETETPEKTSAETPAATEPADEFTEPDASEFTYQYDAALEGVIITGYNGKIHEMRIPTEIEGDRVKSVRLNNHGVVKKVDIPEGISDFFFANCEYLESVILPNGIASIPGGEDSSGIGCFSYCFKLAEVIIPDGVTEIGINAFSHCSSLTSITMPSSVKEIGSGAFAQTGLTEIEIPEGVEAIGFNTFRVCGSLTSVTLPSSITAIGNDAFAACTELKSINIPDGVTYIGKGAFMNCTSLRELALPDSVTEINVGSSTFETFEGCEALTVTYKGQKYNHTNFGDLYKAVNE